MATSLATDPTASKDAITNILQSSQSKSPAPFHAAVIGTISINATNPTPQFYNSGTNSLPSVSPSSATEGSNLTPVTENSVFWLASLGKIVTAIAVMKCIELHSSILNLDTDVGQFVPELSSPQIIIQSKEDTILTTRPAQKKITLRRLLTHTSGLAYEATSPLLLRWRGSQEFLGGNFTGTIDPYNHPLVFEPGESWCYGPGVDWAGRVVEAVTGETLEEFLRKEIWEKLNLEGISFKPETIANFKERQVEMVSKDPTSDLLRSLNISNGEKTYPTNAKDSLGGIGLFSTPKAFIAILELLLQGGGKILTKESIDEIFRNQVDEHGVIAYLNAVLNSDFMVQSGMKASLTKGKRIGAGLGNFVGYEHELGTRGEGTISGMGLPNCSWWVDREKGVAGAVFFQVIPPLQRDLAVIAEVVGKAVYATL